MNTYTEIWQNLVGITIFEEGLRILGYPRLYILVQGRQLSALLVNTPCGTGYHQAATYRSPLFPVPFPTGTLPRDLRFYGERIMYSFR